MIRTFMLAALATAALVGCVAEDTPPTPADRAAQCEASCVAMDGAFERLDSKGCVCLKQGPAEKLDPGESYFDNQCTVSGCIRVCGVGRCVNASSNNNHGCNYYCLAPSVQPDPEPEPEPEPEPIRT